MPGPVQAFLVELCEHWLELNERVSERMAQTAEKIEASLTIPEESKPFLVGLCEDWEAADAQGRQQIRTLLGEALRSGAPPPPKPDPNAYTTPDGRVVASPFASTT